MIFIFSKKLTKWLLEYLVYKNFKFDVWINRMGFGHGDVELYECLQIVVLKKKLAITCDLRTAFLIIFYFEV